MILIVKTKWNSSLTSKLSHAAEETCKAHGLSCRVIEVPGSLEIPLAIKWALKSNSTIQGVVACGVIIKGDTMHFELVSQEASRALTDLGLEYEIPIGNALIPSYTIEQAVDRCGGSKGNKGLEGAEAVVEMLRLKKSIKEWTQ